MTASPCLLGILNTPHTKCPVPFTHPACTLLTPMLTCSQPYTCTSSLVLTSTCLLMHIPISSHLPPSPKLTWPHSRMHVPNLPHIGRPPTLVSHMPLPPAHLTHLPHAKVPYCPDIHPHCHAHTQASPFSEQHLPSSTAGSGVTPGVTSSWEQSDLSRAADAEVRARNRAE